QAARGGDFETLLRLLDPDVVFRADSGMGPVLAPPLVVGRAAVAEQVATQGPRYMPYCEPALVNGAAGLVVRMPGRRPGVVGMTVLDGRIPEIYLILDEEKLRRVDLED